MDERILNQNANTGVIIVPPTPTDFIAGVQSTIEFEVKNPTGDWTPNLPSDEMQIGVYFDTKACVSFSALNCIEAQLNRMLLTGEVTKEEIAEWLGDDGKANLSDRFLAKMSGTTPEGNYMQKVADTLRHFGAVAEKDWNYPRLQRTPVFDWNDFYAEIPDEVKAKGQRFLEKFEIQYEWVQDGDFAKHLKQAPLQIAIGLCQPWDEEVAGCGIKPAAHAITLYAESGGQHKVLDQYEPYRKTLGSDYSIQWVMKIIIKKRTTPMPYEAWKVTGQKDIYIIKDGKKTLVYNAGAFSVIGDWSKIKEVTQAQLDAVPDSGVELAALVKE